MLMTIGKVARRSGLSARTIRYYESIGVLRRAERKNAYRLYSERDVNVIRLIGRARNLGLPLVELRQLAKIVEKGC